MEKILFSQEDMKDLLFRHRENLLQDLIEAVREEEISQKEVKPNGSM